MTTTTITLTKIKRGKKVNSVEFDATGGHRPPVILILGQQWNKEG